MRLCSERRIAAAESANISWTCAWTSPDWLYANFLFWAKKLSLLEMKEVQWKCLPSSVLTTKAVDFINKSKQYCTISLQYFAISWLEFLILDQKCFSFWLWVRSCFDPNSKYMRNDVNLTLGLTRTFKLQWHWFVKYGLLIGNPCKDSMHLAWNFKNVYRLVGYAFMCFCEWHWLV